jgi:hypothetical protein
MLLLGIIICFASATEYTLGSYPSPFVSGGVADVAIIYGVSAAAEDAASSASLFSTSLGSLVTDKGIFDVVISDKGDIPDSNLIIIGGSAVNKVAAKFLGVPYPTYGSQLSSMSQDSAILKIGSNPSYPGKIAVLVAGWEAKDTKAAAKYLILNSTSLSGKTDIVIGK